MTEIEIAVMGKAQGQGIARVVHQNLFPDVCSGNYFASAPRLCGGEMALLAGATVGNRLISLAKGVLHDSTAARQTIQRVEGGKGRMAKRKRRILLYCLIQEGHGIASPAIIVCHCLVKQCDGGGRCGNGKALLISCRHGAAPVAIIPVVLNCL